MFYWRCYSHRRCQSSNHSETREKCICLNCVTNVLGQIGFIYGFEVLKWTSRSKSASAGRGAEGCWLKQCLTGRELNAAAAAGSERVLSKCYETKFILVHVYTRERHAFGISCLNYCGVFHFEWDQIYAGSSYNNTSCILTTFSKSHWSQLKRKGEQGTSMTFLVPQNSAFLSPGRASETQAIATQSEKLGIFVVLWFFFFLLPCSCFHASLKITWRFAWLAVPKLWLTQKGASCNLRKKNDQNMRGKDKNVADKRENNHVLILSCSFYHSHYYSFLTVFVDQCS